MNNNSDLIPPHGGYSKLVTYRLGSLIYDATAAFCKQFTASSASTPALIPRE